MASRMPFVRQVDTFVHHFFGQVEKLWQGFINQSDEGEMRLPTFWAICEASASGCPWGWVKPKASHDPRWTDPNLPQAVAQGDDRAAEFADLSLEDIRFDGHFEDPIPIHPMYGIFTYIFKFS